MKRLRVGYDVSFLAPLPGESERITGVGRAIRYTLDELCLRDDLDIRIVGSFEGDWNYLSTNLRAQRWAASLGRTPPVQSLPAINSALGLGHCLSAAVLSLESLVASGKGVQRRRRSGEVLLLRTVRKVASLACRPHFNPVDFDLFHATFMPPPLKALSRRTPRVVTIYDMIPLRLPAECGKHVTGQFARTISSLDPVRDVVITISHFSKQDICELLHFPQDRVVVAPLAPPKHFRPVKSTESIRSIRERTGIGELPYFLSVANPQPRKNLPHLVRSFYRFLTKTPQWNGLLVLAGDPSLGWGSEPVNAAIESMPEFSRRVLRVGSVADDDLPALYSSALAFVFPSLYEGFGLPALEAMACGSAVISADTTSLPEVIGKAGLLLNGKDEEALSSALSLIAFQPDLRRRLSEMAVHRAAEFSWKQTADNVVFAYQLATQSSRPSQIFNRQ